jgi:hypothetical protein
LLNFALLLQNLSMEGKKLFLCLRKPLLCEVWFVSTNEDESNYLLVPVWQDYNSTIKLVQKIASQCNWRQIAKLAKLAI